MSDPRTIRVNAPADSEQALEFVLKQACDSFAQFGEPSPPIPYGLSNYVPCRVFLTTRRQKDSIRGRIQFLRLDGSTSYDAEWLIR